MEEFGGGTNLDRALEPRSLVRAMKRGARGRCPNCGDGSLFKSYLKVAATCPACGEDLSHQRADDAPPYVTIFVVGHVVIAGLILAQELWPDVPVAVQVIGWSLVTIALSLALLPVAKGALIGLQWALRMHGFDTHGQNAAPARPVVRSDLLGMSHPAS